MTGSEEEDEELFSWEEYLKKCHAKAVPKETFKHVSIFWLVPVYHRLIEVQWHFISIHKGQRLIRVVALYIENNTWAHGDMKFIFKCST